MNILGISAFYHDSAAALISNGKIIAAAQEERFSRIKHDAKFPYHSIRYVLHEANISLSEVDYITFYDKPILKFERLLESYLASVPKGFLSFKLAIPIWIKEKLFLKNTIINNLRTIDKKISKDQIKFSEHHISHAASSFYTSSFKKSLILTIDGVGEWATTSIGIGEKNKIKILKELHYPHSLGLLYSAFTYYLGFKVNSGEYKVMGLAPYGKPKYEDIIKKNLLIIKADGSFKLNLKFFDYVHGLKMINNHFEDLFGQPARIPEIEKINQFHMDIAASIQKVTEYIILLITNNLKEKYKIDNLCMAGGVALNCVANGKVLNENIFKNIYIQPASGDAGGAIGSALYFWYHEKNNPRNDSNSTVMHNALLGPKFNDTDINKMLIEQNATFKKYVTKELISKTAKFLASGKVVGWFQGRMEFGPRALGSRSILADPRDIKMQSKVNLKIKYRESFRPFAPSILVEHFKDWYDINVESPYMLYTASLKDNKRIKVYKNNSSGLDLLKIKRSDVPAVTHVDFSSRIQTVTKNENVLYYDLIKKFYEITNCPIVLNTSFNVRGEPIVCSPIDAYKCFMATDMDYLCIGNYIVSKKQFKKITTNSNFELD